MSDCFQKPIPPTGYVVFDYESKCFRGKYLHISDISKFCMAHNIPPTEVVVFRTFGSDTTHYDRKLMNIDEYAFKHRYLEAVGHWFIEREEWFWTPQPIVENVVDARGIVTTIKNKYYNLRDLFYRICEALAFWNF